VMEPIGCDVLTLPFDGTPPGNGNLTEARSDRSVYQNGELTCYSACNDDDGKYNYSYYFYAGTSNYLEYSSPASCLRPSTNLTVELWFNATALGGNQTLFDCQDGYRLYLSFDKSIRFEINSSDGYHQLSTDNNFVQQGYWYHVAGTFDGYRQRLFVNGVCKAKRSTSTLENITYSQAQSLCIGRHAGSPSEYFTGYIDNVRVSNLSKDLTEDSDGDRMSDMYEIMRSVNSDQYDSFVHNGRYAVMSAAVDHNTNQKDDSFKYNTIRMYQYLIVNGWNKNDIILLISDNQYEPYINYSEVDGFSSLNNIDNATENSSFAGIRRGGGYQLKQNDNSYKSFFTSKSIINDTILIYFEGHGNYSGGPVVVFFRDCAIESTAMDHNSSYKPTGPNDTGLDAFQCKYLFLYIQACHSGGFLEYCSGNNRIVLTLTKSEVYTGSFVSSMPGQRLWGEIDARFYIDGGFHDESELDYDFNPDWEPISIFPYIWPFYRGNEEIIDADGIIGLQEDDEEYNRENRISNNSFCDGFISIQEAYYMDDLAVYDRFGETDEDDHGQNLQINLGLLVPDQLFL
jgi:hypothetical protein